MTARLRALADLFAALAAALAEPAPGLPQADLLPALRETTRRALPYLPAAASDALAALEALAAPAPGELIARRRHIPGIWYQSLAHGERLLGPTADHLRAEYARAGLEVAPEELPDHAAVEVAFLSWLCAAQAGCTTLTEAGRLAHRRREFLRQHALTWLPTLAQTLQASGDPFYAPVGLLLATALQAAHRSPRRRAQPAWLPVIDNPAACVLCGFCRQACPCGALRIHEDDNHTRLMLYPTLCTACERCLPVCPTQALQHGTTATEASVELRRSPRAHCLRCGQPTVSQAELEWVHTQLQDSTTPTVLTRTALCVACK